MLAIKKRLRRILVATRDHLFMFHDAFRDAIHYARTAGPSDSAMHPNLKESNREAQLTKDYHRIEKGLALATPKTPFGRDVVSRLTLLSPKTDDENIAELSAVTALNALTMWNAGDNSGRDLVAPVASELAQWELEDFFSSRFSLRDFASDLTLSAETIRKIASIASSTPSVCNRQTGRLHFYQEPTLIETILNEQQGSNGFKESISNLCIVTVKTSLFTGPRERNQRWIDGGLYAMTTVWGMHSLGLGTCMLNWSRFSNETSRLRRIANIPVDEDVICLIAFGYPADKFSRRARSPKRDLSSTFYIHK